MPFERPSLSALIEHAQADIAQATSNPSLRFSNLGVTATAQAGLAHQHYGYLDWIAKQAIPLTCDEEYLEGWAALKNVNRKPATKAQGTITFSGTAGLTIPVGAAIVRGDGTPYISTAAATISAGGVAQVLASAVNADSASNTELGSTMILAQTIAGIQSTGIVSTAFVGGADIEDDESLRTRMLAKYQAPPTGAGVTDYIAWATSAPNVTRAWCVPNGFGVGSVVLYVMMDVLRIASGGIPAGAAGVATAEWRGTLATGDLLAVADAIYPQSPPIGIVYLAAPIPRACDFTLANVSASLQTSALASLQSTLIELGAPGCAIKFNDLSNRLAQTLSGHYFTLTPAQDIVCAASQIPILGNVTFT